MLLNKGIRTPPIVPITKPTAMTFFKIKSKEPIEKKLLFTKVKAKPEAYSYIPISVKRVPSKVAYRHENANESESDPSGIIFTELPPSDRSSPAENAPILI